ncbi:hypothetical protein MJO28_014734 [Puccinia striiformis f. sp. tritici]|nr:hypothetical protein MJO28_014734 [Puccinia striiformis f. sp. tritici]KAI7939779.1 hypothetical protein MJO29_014515 [Puccinia striiformis f. sp. tritici]KAI9631476.1 hypothetical protein KEM48_014300 [Puccinia striiformis f. sp. tritici PST-130]
MAPKLLSFILIITTTPLHQVISTPVYSPVPFEAAGGVRSSTWMDRLSTFSDRSHDLTSAEYARRPGPAELPTHYHADRLPHDVFPDDDPLQALASQKAVWIKSQKVNPLSIDTEAEWASHAKVYGELNKEKLGQLEAWIEEDIIKGSDAAANLNKRLNWSLGRANQPIWWKASLVKKADLKAGEDIDLINIGDILIQLRNKKELADHDVQNAVSQLHNIFSNPFHQTSRTKPLKVFLIDQENIEKAPLYTENVTKLRQHLQGSLARMSDEDQQKAIEVLYLAHGFYPKMASESSSVALRNIQNDSKAWDELGKGDFENFRKILVKLKDDKFLMSTN